jgi:hypothetical protein
MAEFEEERRALVSPAFPRAIFRALSGDDAMAPRRRLHLVPSSRAV